MTYSALKGKKILVTGGNGQLATSLHILGGESIIKVGRPQFDFDKPETLAQTFDRVQPDYVVNAAAWTAVDLAESEKEGAERANHTGPAALAALCTKRNVPFIHVSTDYVFDGTKGAPYIETDATSPRTVYGSTKAAGEQAVLKAAPRSIILRTAWVYSSHGKNFIKTILNAATKFPELKVVADQHGNPTSSDDLAQAILAILYKIEEEGWQDSFGGIYHAVGSGAATWHQLAVASLEQAHKHGHPMPPVKPIHTEDWPTPAERPQDSRLDTAKLYEIFHFRFPQWQESVQRTVDEIIKAAS